MESGNDRGAFTRREALRLLGAGGGAGLLASLGILSVPGRGVARVAQQGPVIRTILRDIAPNQMPEGAVLFHEHLSIQLGANPSFHSDVELMIKEVRAAQADGIACIVDGGHPDMARDIEAIRRIARESGMPIVASGGYYMQRTYPDDIATKSASQIADDLVAEAQRDRLGAYGEIGQQGGVLTDDERKVHQAVAQAHPNTGTR
jgi:predicted metal-dependent phosphotriesterase family hydrolase